MDVIGSNLGANGSHSNAMPWSGQGMIINGHDVQPDDATRESRYKRRETLQPQAHLAHQCRVCQRTFERVDHLTRHLKSHENARPFKCQQCPKSFNRIDLLSRHVASHERNASACPSRAQIRRTDRAEQACVGCAAAKARCDDRKPCRRCRAKKITCETIPQPSYNRDQSSGGDESNAPYRISAGHTVHPSEQTNNESMWQQMDTSCHVQYQSPMETLSTEANIYTTPPMGHVGPGTDTTCAPPVESMLQPTTLYDIDSLPQDSSQLNFESIMDEMLYFPNQADFNNQNLDFGLQDFDFQDEHLRVDTATPEHVCIDGNAHSKSTKKTHGARRDISRSYAAFKRSPWLWTPAPKDHVLSDQDNLAVDEEIIASTFTPRSAGLMPDIPSCGFPSIDARLRDKMFYIVSTMNKYARNIPNFPSLDLLNHIVEAFFVKHHYQVDSFIHVATTSLMDILPEFSIALVTAGSTVISVPAIWKMGLVLQDVVRCTLGDLWESQNSETRKLHPLQAWMLILDSGLWSGFQRQMELAESFGQPMITMIRRGGIMAAPADTKALIPDESDTGQILETKWKKWVQRESFKRLSIHLFLHDTRASVALQKNPLISFTEISFSLPASRTLFLAASAAEWKSKYMEQRASSKRPLPRLIDAMHNLSMLENLYEEADINLCYTTLVNGFWGQIWAFRESSKFHDIDENGDSVHRLWLLTQQRETYREVESFKDKLLALPNQHPELIVTIELFLMILYVSPEELQRFAGKAGEESASHALVTLERWSATDSSRRAVWHAAQVLRWAALIPATELRDFYAIAVYFASITMWAYAHLLSSASRNLSEQSKAARPLPDPLDGRSFVILNGPETHETRAFIMGSSGTPALMPLTPRLTLGPSGAHSDAFVILSDPNSALKMACDLFRSNFPVVAEPLPPLVENMGNLMRDLSSLPDSRFSRCTSPLEH